MNDTKSESIDSLEGLLREALAASQERQWRRDNPYVADLIELLLPYGQRGMPRAKAIDQLETTRRKKGLPVPKTFEQTVQSAFNQHCINSEVFLKRKVFSDGVFSSRRDGNEALWIAHPRMAHAWLVARDKKR